jgi:segregation and condensation protein A
MPAPANAYQVKLPIFEGPLDLLLYLIEREELDITAVSLAAVTEQYITYMSLLENLIVDQLADFLVIAAKLILIKSRLLLPQPETPSAEGEEDVGEPDPARNLCYRVFVLVVELQGLPHYLALREVCAFLYFSQ